MNSITHLELSHGSNITLYADDILLYKPINSADDLILLQQDVHSDLNWIKSNGLSLNTAKTQLINISRSPKATPLHITVNGHTVHQSDSVVYLGVTLNSSLSWSPHIKNTCRSTIRQLGLIHRKLHSAPQSVRLKICSSVVLPKLDYCCAVWDPHLAKDKAELDRVQKFATRIITHKWKENLSSLRERLGWRDLTTRRKLIKLKVCFKIMHNLSPIPSSTFTRHPHPSPRHPHNMMIFQPFVSCNSHLHSFFINVIKHWKTACRPKQLTIHHH